MTSKFIKAAVAEMLRQKDVEYVNQVGSKRTEPDGVGKEKTDCITYVIKVLGKAYRETGNPEAAKTVAALAEDGSDLARHLVDALDWKAYYWNPDVRSPADPDEKRKQEHPSSYKDVVRTGIYDRKIKITGTIINYRPTGTLTKQDRKGLERLEGVEFAYGIAHGAQHTFLLSRGNVYEVHWKGIGASLYSMTPFASWKHWYSGAVMLPPGITEIASLQ